MRVGLFYIVVLRHAWHTEESGLFAEMIMTCARVEQLDDSFVNIKQTQMRIWLLMINKSAWK